MKTKPFDGVKMGKTKEREYKIGNKKLSKKLKNIKMFEEFSMNESTEKETLKTELLTCLSDYGQTGIDVEEFDEKNEELKRLYPQFSKSIDDIFSEIGEISNSYEEVESGNMEESDLEKEIDNVKTHINSI